MINYDECQEYLEYLTPAYWETEEREIVINPTVIRFVDTPEQEEDTLEVELLEDGMPDPTDDSYRLWRITGLKHDTGRARLFRCKGGAFWVPAKLIKGYDCSTNFVRVWKGFEKDLIDDS